MTEDDQSTGILDSREKFSIGVGLVMLVITGVIFVPALLEEAGREKVVDVDGDGMISGKEYRYQDGILPNGVPLSENMEERREQIRQYELWEDEQLFQQIMANRDRREAERARRERLEAQPGYLEGYNDGHAAGYSSGEESERINQEESEREAEAERRPKFGDM